MEQTTELTFSHVIFNSEENKENEINLSNQTSLMFSPKPSNQSEVRNQRMEEILNEKLMQNFNRVSKSMKKLDLIEKETHLNDCSPGMRKIKLIEKLIDMMETNKNMRIREMFQERQRLSESRDEQKKGYQRKLEKVKQVQHKFKQRKIDEFTAIHELNGIRG